MENVGSCRYANNLFVYAPGCGKKGEETYEVKISKIDRNPRFYSDYNGIRYIADEMFFKPYLFDDDQEYATLEEFSAATGYEENSVRAPGFAELFQNVPEPTKDTLYEPESGDFRLRRGSGEAGEDRMYKEKVAAQFSSSSRMSHVGLGARTNSRCTAPNTLPLPKNIQLIAH